MLDRLDVIEFGEYFGSHSTVNQWARRPAPPALLTWIGPLSSTITTGLVLEARLGSRRAMKSALRLVGEVVTVSFRPT